MRKTRILLTLALCLCLTSACGAEDLLSRMTGGRSETVLDSSGTDTASPAAPGAELPDPSETDLQVAETPSAGASGSGADFSALTAEQCVADDWPDPGVLPRITLDCPGAETINRAIQDQFASVADDPLWELYYLCAKGAGRVLSVVMVQRANDWTTFTPFNLDLATGQALSGRELLALLEVDEAELAQQEQAILGEEFTHQFGDRQAETEQTFYDQQYQRTTAADNTELDRLWFGGDGQLCFAGRIYGLAGAEYYEYQLATGRVF